MQVNEIGNVETKREWTPPEVTSVVAGSAESQRGSFPDGGGGNQGS